MTYFCGQAKELIEQLVVNLYINHIGCYYDGDIRAVFVEADGHCQPFRIGATITSEINSSFRCLNASKISNWLLHWNSTIGTVEMFRNVNVDHDQPVNLTYCNPRIEGVPDVRIQECHRVFYCSKLPKKDRTVCLENGRFRKRVTQVEQNFVSGKNPRILCVTSV